MLPADVVSRLADIFFDGNSWWNSSIVLFWKMLFLPHFSFSCQSMSYCFAFSSCWYFRKCLICLCHTRVRRMLEGPHRLPWCEIELELPSGHCCSSRLFDWYRRCLSAGYWQRSLYIVQIAIGLEILHSDYFRAYRFEKRAHLFEYPCGIVCPQKHQFHNLVSFC